MVVCCGSPDCSDWMILKMTPPARASLFVGAASLLFSTAKVAFLTITSSSRAFALKGGTTTIGRSHEHATVALNEPVCFQAGHRAPHSPSHKYISIKHAMIDIDVQNGTAWIIDLASTSKTYLDSRSKVPW